MTPFGRLVKLPGYFQVHPYMRAGSKRSRNLLCRLSGNCLLAIDDLIDRLKPPAQNAGKRCLTPATGAKLVANEFAGR